MAKPVHIVWFRNDLRLTDNPALYDAAKAGTVLPIYIHDTTCPKEFTLGRASRTWLRHSLESLQKSLDGHLNLYEGDAQKVIAKLSKEYSIEHVYFSLSYEPWHLQQQECVEKLLAAHKIPYTAYNSAYLYNPHDVLKDDGTYYKVFTAYKNKALHLKPREPIARPRAAIFIKDNHAVHKVEQLELTSHKEWESILKKHWTVGEKAAHQALSLFIKNKVHGYKKGRDYPFDDHTSRLSPHLHFGEISPYQIWDEIMHGNHAIPAQDRECFLTEIVWREFSSYLLYHFKHLHKENFQERFNSFAWKHNQKILTAWKEGKTGYPIVDAGMRQLRETGYMHNRVRMIVGSFLVKNLRIDWRDGMRWFWECLMDADLASNAFNWQWVAGSGADAAPYFRIFNPITQAKKFDEEGTYIKKYVPELKKLPIKYLFEPWKVPQQVLDAAGIELGKTYPLPIIDLKVSSKEALAAYQKTK